MDSADIFNKQGLQFLQLREKKMKENKMIEGFGTLEEPSSKLTGTEEAKMAQVNTMFEKRSGIHQDAGDELMNELALYVEEKQVNPDVKESKKNVFVTKAANRIGTDEYVGCFYSDLLQDYHRQGNTNNNVKNCTTKAVGLGDSYIGMQDSYGAYEGGDTCYTSNSAEPSDQLKWQPITDAGIPEATSCTADDCPLEGQFCPPGVKGAGTEGKCCHNNRWKTGKCPPPPRDMGECKCRTDNNKGRCYNWSNGRKWCYVKDKAACDAKGVKTDQSQWRRDWWWARTDKPGGQDVCNAASDEHPKKIKQPTECKERNGNMYGGYRTAAVYKVAQPENPNLGKVAYINHNGKRQDYNTDVFGGDTGATYDYNDRRTKCLFGYKKIWDDGQGKWMCQPPNKQDSCTYSFEGLKTYTKNEYDRWRKMLSGRGCKTFPQIPKWTSMYSYTANPLVTTLGSSSGRVSFKECKEQCGDNKDCAAFEHYDSARQDECTDYSKWWTSWCAWAKRAGYCSRYDNSGKYVKSLCPKTCGTCSPVPRKQSCKLKSSDIYNLGVGEPKKSNLLYVKAPTFNTEKSCSKDVVDIQTNQFDKYLIGGNSINKDTVCIQNVDLTQAKQNYKIASNKLANQQLLNMEQINKQANAAGSLADGAASTAAAGNCAIQWGSCPDIGKGAYPYECKGTVTTSGNCYNAFYKEMTGDNCCANDDPNCKPATECPNNMTTSKVNPWNTDALANWKQQIWPQGKTVYGYRKTPLNNTESFANLRESLVGDQSKEAEASNAADIANLDYLTDPDNQKDLSYFNKNVNIKEINAQFPALSQQFTSAYAAIGDERNKLPQAEAMLEDSQLRMMSSNYENVMWSILAIMIVLGCLKLSKK